MGLMAEPPVQDETCTSVPRETEVLEAAECGGARLSFTFQLCQQTTVVWQAMLYSKSLYLKPGESLPDGSKEAFVSLLEYAEEFLKCQHIFVCFRKPAVTKALIRTFMFLGFTLLPPKHPKSPPGDFISLLYTVEEDASSDAFD